jgi:transcriptional regulator with XRE-family HTH domain
MSLGSRLRERRQQLGLTLEEVAQAVGVSKSTVQKWESGTIEDMRLTKAAGLAKVLKVSPLRSGPRPTRETKGAEALPGLGSTALTKNNRPAGSRQSRYLEGRLL